MMAVSCRPTGPRAMLLLATVVALLSVPSAAAVPRLPASPEAAPARRVPVLAYYYIWFGPASWNRAKTDYPVLGRYSSDDREVMRQHIRWAKAAGIDGFIVSWKSTDVLDQRLSSLVEIANQENFKLAIIYQGLDFNRRPQLPEIIAEDLELFWQEYGENPAFNLFGRPLIIWSGTWEFDRAQIAQVTASRRSRMLILASERNAGAYLNVADLFDGDAYYWSSVDPRTYPNYPGKLQAMAAAVRDNSGIWIAPAAPGFDARLIGGTRVVERRDGGTLREEFAAAGTSNPDAIGLISWNEFSENSQVEPSCNYGADALAMVAEIRGGQAPVLPGACDAAILTGATTAATPVSVSSVKLDDEIVVRADSGDDPPANDIRNRSDFDSSSPGATQSGVRGLFLLALLGLAAVVCLAIVAQRARRQGRASNDNDGVV